MQIDSLDYKIIEQYKLTKSLAGTSRECGV